MTKDNDYTKGEVKNLTNTTKSGVLEDITYLETISPRLMEYCSRYDSCDAPLCPLDVLIDTRPRFSDDDRCEMAKSTRHKYWISMPDDLKKFLPYEGYFKSEFSRIRASKKRWEGLSPEEKNKIIERGRQALSRAKNARR
jgi:hypothetical protein